MPATRKSAGRIAYPPLIGLLLAAGLTWVGPAGAQSVTDALSGFSADSDQPVRIESDVLEVRDNDRVAVFSGNVIVRQGGTTMTTATLTVHYTGGSPAGEAPDADAAQSISKLEAKGSVVVETGDQKATGEWAVFEMESQEITLGGDVVLSQGNNVLRGSNLVVNLVNGTSKLVSPSTGGGRVQGLFIPGAMGQKQERSQDRSN